MKLQIFNQNSMQNKVFLNHRKVKNKKTLTKMRELYFQLRISYASTSSTASITI